MSRRHEREQPEFLVWVRTQGCFLAPFGECQGRTEPHHAGQRGVGLKSADVEAVPLCTKHHRQYHDHTGRFRWQSHAELLAWRAYAIEQTQAGYVRAQESVELVPF